MKSGLLIVLSGPAGVGKGTVVSRACERNPDIILSVSATSREPRPGELQGVNYHFVSKERFEEMIRESKLLEWVQYCGNYYGTPREFVEQQIEKGHIVILEIEVEGAQKIKQAFPQSISVFITPPTLEELKRRLTKRGTETPEVIHERMQRALKELEHIDDYDYVIMNNTVDESATQFLSILDKEQSKGSKCCC